MRPHTKRPKHQGDAEGREYHREVQESATEVVWPRKEAIPRLRRKKYSGDGSPWEKKARKTEAEMDGLCQPGHESHQNDKRRGPGQNCLEENFIYLFKLIMPFGRGWVTPLVYIRILIPLLYRLQSR